MTSKLSTFFSFFKNLRNRSGKEFYLSLATMVYLGLTEGIGLMLIIPFIALAGIGEGSLGNSKLVGFVRQMIEQLQFTPTLLNMLLVYVLLLTFYAFVKYIQSRLNVSISQNMVRKWRQELYSDIVYSNWRYIVSRKLPELVNTIVKEVAQVGQGTNQFVQLIGSSIILVVQTILAFLISPSLTFIAVSGSLILGLASKRFNKKSFELGQRDFGTNRNLHTQSFEQLSALKLAKSYGLEERSTSEFNALTDKIADVTIEMRNLSAKNKMLISIGSAVLLSVFFIIAIEMIDASLGQMLLLAFIFSRMIPKISSIISSYQGILNMLPAYMSVVKLQREIKQDTREEKKLNDVDLTFTKSIDFENVSFSYNSTSPVLKNLSISFPKGSHTAIIGESGKGKSTLADLMMGLITPTSGDINIDSKPLSNSTFRSWRRKVGYIPQDNFLFHDTLKHNLTWLRPESSLEEINAALAQAEMLSFVESLSEGLETIVGDRGVRMSGGQRQRIILARTLLLKPEVLILDEATSALDPTNETAILNTIGRLKSDITVIIISHKKNISNQVSRVIDLSEKPSA